MGGGRRTKTTCHKMPRGGVPCPLPHPGIPFCQRRGLTRTHEGAVHPWGPGGAFACPHMASRAVPPTKGWCRLRTTPVHPQSRRQSRSAQNSLSTRLAHSRSPRTLDALRSVPDDAMASACPQCRRRLRHLVERGSRALVSWELVLSVRAGSVPAWCLRLQTLHAAHQLLQLSHYGVSR